MNDEERQRTMDFILQQQAQLTASQQNTNGRLRRVERVVVQMAQQFRQERKDLRERIGALVDAQVKAEDKASRTEDVLKRLEASHERSEARLTRLEDLTESNSKAIDALTTTSQRNSEAISKLAESNDRNSEAISKLTDVIADIARRNGGESA